MGSVDIDASVEPVLCEYRQVFAPPDSLKEARTHYCSGCTHGVIHRLIAEIIDEMKARERTIAVAPVGCAVLAYDYFRFDVSEAPHGRTPCVATGIKRVHPNHLVFTYQGDGDMAAIGCGEIIHTACRGENITVVFINNGVYGMTGGQMAPTTLVGQKTLTTPRGRDVAMAGYPVNILDMLAVAPGSSYVARGIATTPKSILNCKKLIRRAFRVQEEKRGFSIVEILSTCPVGWHLTPQEANKRVEEVVSKIYPPGILKDTSGLDG